MVNMNNLVAVTVIYMTIYCSSFLLKPQKAKTKTTMNSLVVVDKREEDEIIKGATTTTTMAILYLLCGLEWSQVGCGTTTTSPSSNKIRHATIDLPQSN